MWIAFLCFVSRGLFIYHKCKNQNAQNQEFKSQDRLINVNYVTSNLNINDENDWLCHFKLDHVCAQWAHWIRYLLSASHSSQRGQKREIIDFLPFKYLPQTQLSPKFASRFAQSFCRWSHRSLESTFTVVTILGSVPVFTSISDGLDCQVGRFSLTFIRVSFLDVFDSSFAVKIDFLGSGLCIRGKSIAFWGAFGVVLRKFDTRSGRMWILGATF